jgi:signal transduction histidine kinase
MQVTTRAHAMGAVVAAAGVLALGAWDLHRGAPHLEVVLAARATWAAALLGLAAYALRARERQLPLPCAIAAVASVAALAALAWADGAAGTGSITYLVAAPLFVALFVPDPRVAAAGAAAALAGTVAVGAALDLPAAAIARVATRSAFAGAFAVFGSWVQDRSRRQELSLARERARAVEALAASERRRLETEPLAAAGSRAVRAAHDMSGPIAAIRSNLDWLDEALRSGRLSAADDEVSSAVEDGRAAVEALVRALQELRRAPDGAPRRTPMLGGQPGARLARASRNGE